MSLQVPETVEEGRVVHGVMASNRGDNFGAFTIRATSVAQAAQVVFSLIVSGGDELVRWEHVSVTVLSSAGPKGNSGSRMPSWSEMMRIKEMFWEEEDVCVQYAPKASEYLNIHPNVLHWWRPLDDEMPTPPTLAV